LLDISGLYYIRYGQVLPAYSLHSLCRT
jgi:hypothetical protein